MDEVSKFTVYVRHCTQSRHWERSVRCAAETRGQVGPGNGAAALRAWTYACGARSESLRSRSFLSEVLAVFHATGTSWGRERKEDALIDVDSKFGSLSERSSKFARWSAVRSREGAISKGSELEKS